MYQLILAQKKAKEAAMMAELPGMKVKPKYEYDSDEDTEGGTWEHKQRMNEMQATKGKRGHALVLLSGTSKNNSGVSPQFPCIQT